MTLQMLQYFLAIARVRNFTKASEECFVTQPTLSRAIRDLEEELGCELLRRTSRSVELTEAGEVCVQEAQHILSHVQRMKDRVIAASRVQEDPVRLGYIIYDHLMSFLKLLSDPETGKLPVQVDPKYSTCPELKRLFVAGELDMLVLAEPSTLDLDNAERFHLTNGRAYAIVPRSSPLFTRETLRLEELRDHAIIGWDEKDVPLLNAAYVSMLIQAGIKPRVVAKAEKMSDMLAKVRIYQAIGFGTSAATDRSSEDVRYILIEDSPENFGIVCLWHKDTPAPQTLRLAGILKSLSE